MPLHTEISNLQKLGKVADNETISKLQSYRDELVRNAGPDGPVNLDLKQLSDLRSQFRMDVKGERPVYQTVPMLPFSAFTRQ